VLHIHSIKPNFLAVYRVSWLRAKARYDRWDEEFLIVRHEMRWTILWFKYQLKEWSRRSAESEGQEKAGKRAYAEKQIAMWKMFAEEAESGFKHKAID
jgi:hypothetical protein